MARKMPHSKDLRTNGKFDRQKFTAAAPVALEAISSGATKVSKIVIDARGKDLDPAISSALSQLMMDLDSSGTISVTDMTEAGSETYDVLTVTMDDGTRVEAHRTHAK